MKSRSTWSSIGVAVLCIVAAASTARANDALVGHGRIDLRADLDDGDASSTAIYRERVVDGRVDRRFILRARNVTPGDVVHFFLRDELVAAAVADGSGLALLRVRTPQFIEDPGDWLPMPQTFPRLRYGDAVRIGLRFGAMVYDGLELFDGAIDLRANLFGAGPMTGRAIYREREVPGEGLDRRFIVRVNNAEPNTLVRIYLRDQTLMLGAIADADGTAVLRVRTPQFIDDPEDAVPMPITFPRLLPGDEVIVGSRSGYFFSEDAQIRQVSQRVRLDAIFGVPGFVVGDAAYSERIRRGRLERAFTVFVENAEPGDLLPVRLNGFTVAMIPIGPFGRGQLELRSAPFINGPADGDPMPATFPSILDGWVITVGVQNGAFVR